MSKKRQTVGIRHAIKQKIDALKVEATRLAGLLLGEEKNIPPAMHAIRNRGQDGAGGVAQDRNPKSH